MAFPEDYESIMYAQRRTRFNGTAYFMNFGPSVMVAELYGKHDDIHKLRITPAREADVSSYWGWWDEEKQQLRMIYPDRVLLSICFPYGIKAEEKAGKGFAVRLVVEDLGVAVRRVKEASK